jgi:hypothetical protein
MIECFIDLIVRAGERLLCSMASSISKDQAEITVLSQLIGTPYLPLC